MDNKNRGLEDSSSVFWNKKYFFLNLSFFLVFSNISFLYLYPLALEAMGNNHHIIGMTMGIFSFSAVVSRPLMGKLAALKGEYRVMSFGIAMIFVSSISYSLIKDFLPLILLIRILHGIGFSAFISGSFSFAAKTVNPDRRGEAFSIIGAFIMAAVSLAPAFGELLIKYWGFTALYFAASGTILLAWFSVCSTGTCQAFLQSKEKKVSSGYRHILKNRSFFYLLCLTFIFSHCQATVLNFIALISAEHGVSSGPFFLISYLTAIFILLTMGKVFDYFAKLSFIILAYPLFATGIIIIPQLIDTRLFLIPAVIYGLGVGLMFPPLNALAAGYGSRAEKPAVMSVFTVVYDSGFITGAVISGWIASLTSLDMLFLSCGLFSSIGFLVVMVFPGKKA